MTWFKALLELYTNKLNRYYDGKEILCVLFSTSMIVFTLTILFMFIFWGYNSMAIRIAIASAVISIATLYIHKRLAENYHGNN